MAHPQWDQLVTPLVSRALRFQGEKEVPHGNNDFPVWDPRPGTPDGGKNLHNSRAQFLEFGADSLRQFLHTLRGVTSDGSRLNPVSRTSPYPKSAGVFSSCHESFAEWVLSFLSLLRLKMLMIHSKMFEKNRLCQIQAGTIRHENCAGNRIPPFLTYLNFTSFFCSPSPP